MQATTVSGILLLSAIVLFVLALFTIYRRKITGAPAFSILLMAMVIHTVGYAMELMATSKAEMANWLRFEYMAISFFPSIMLWFASQYTDEKRIANRWIRSLVFTMNAFTFGTVVIGDPYHLYYQSMEVVESYGMQVLYLPRAIWGNLQHALLLLVMAYAIVGVSGKLKKSAGAYRSRARYMMAGLMVPLAVYAMYASGLGPVAIDFMPFTYVLMSVLIGIGLFRFDMLLMTPVTYEMIFRSIDEGVLVIDRNGLMIRANDAAKRYFPSLLALKEGGKSQSIDELAGFDFESPEVQWTVGEKIFNTKRISADNNRGVIYLFNDVTEAEKSKRELEIMATIDPLTGIQNRRVFMEKLEKAPDGVFAIMDLDFFKEINDQKGHHEGDQILKAFAQAMRKHYSFQKVCRYGGEEFAVFFPKATLQAAFHSLDLFRRQCIEDEIGIRFSAGMAEYKHGLINLAILEADKKLYEAKAKGRDQIQI